MSTTRATSEARIPRLIVTLGDSTGGSIWQATKSDRPRPTVAASMDSLSSGPLRPLDDLDAFAEARADFWRPVYADSGAPVELAAAEFRAEIDRFVQLVRHADCTELWVGWSVAEQVFAAFFVALCNREALEPSTTLLRQFPRSDSLPGLGCTSVAALATPPAPERLENVQGAYAAAWHALTAAEPSELVELTRFGTGRPAIEAALSAMLLRYPDAGSGLGSVDCRVLERTPAVWTKSAHVVGEAMALGTPLHDLIGDGLLFARLKALAAGPRPCIEFRGNTSTMRSCEVRLTGFGADCLAGRANRLESGIDEWIGGVHLSSAAGRVWVRDGTSIVPA